MEKPDKSEIDALVDGLMPLHRPKPDPDNDPPAEKPKNEKQLIIEKIIR